jgi:SpoVK/Ycf46/Vps4 family AAA+-type ATPase
MTYTNSFFGIPEDDTRFNLAAAVDTYEWVLANPDISDFVISKVLFDFVPADLEKNKDKVDEFAREYMSKRLDAAKRGISRTISKTITPAEEQMVIAVEEISKAYDQWQRHQIADRRTRDNSGRFMREAMRAARQENERVARDRAQAVYPRPRGNRRNWTPDEIQQNIAHQREFNAIVQELNSASRADARAEFGARPQDNAPQGDSPYFDPLSAMELPEFNDQAYRNGVRSFGEGWMRQGPDDYRTTDQFWRRTSTAAGLSAAVAGSTGNQQAATALMAGKFVGDMAPEAEKVMGPTARRAAYRYRGTEKTPNPRYQRLVDGAKRHYGSGSVARENLLRGNFQQIPINPNNPTAGTREIWTPSPLIEEMQKTLPDPQRYHLNRKAGTIPPSQGIIIDRSGKVTREAVGYGEDWYLPFNLSHMKDLRGGEYIRTRAFGGLTTEDVTAGLISGARSVTVVSHSGVFTMEFDPTFKGSKRYNDKAARMAKRYGQLLDAVKSKEVSLGSIPPERNEELKELAARKYSPDLDVKAYKEQLKKLQDKEREDPKLADATKKEILTQLLNERVQDDDPAKDFQSFQLAAEAAANKNGNYDVVEQISTPEKAIAYFGMEIQAKKAIEDAQATYEQEMNPLDLNGRGYYQAAKALQDQFPYYVKDVWHTDFHNGNQDYGYVKARFTRPEGALAGYYDPTITGKPKISADKTQYQNYGVMGTKEFAMPPFTPKGSSFVEAKRYKKDEERPAAVRAGQTGPLQGMAVGATPKEEVNDGLPKAPSKSSSADQTEAILQMVDHLRGQRKFGAGAGEAYAHRGISPADWNSLKGQYPELLGKEPDDIRLMMYRLGPDSEYAKKLRGEIDSLLDMNYFSVDENVRRAYTQGKSAVLRETPETGMEFISSYPMINSGTVFDFSEVPQDRTRQFYNETIREYLAGSEGLREAGITPDSTRKEIVDAAVKRGQQLAEQYRLWSRRDAGLQATTVPTLSMDDIEREGRYMAYVVQAAVLRDQTPEPEEVHVEEPVRGERKTVSSDDAERLKSAAAASGVVQRKEKVKELQGKIHAMIGMDQVSKEIDSLVNEAEVNAYLEAHGMPVTPPIRHMVFAGAPGTGKTTVAHILAPIYADMGLIPSDKVVVKSRDDLVQANQGNTEEAVKKAFDEAKGGVLFIDEAYSLKVDDMDTLGQIAVNSINQKASENQNDTVVILAGYPDEMENLLKNNPGLKSRFPTTIHFRNYNPKEMKQIAEKMMKDDGYRMTPASRASAILGQVTSRIANDPDSANGRDVFNLYQKIARAHKNRLAGTNPTKAELEIITADDVIEGIATYDENLLTRRNTAA